MKSIEQYAAGVLEKYRVAADSESESHQVADELATVLKHWGKQYFTGMTISGAYAKNTAIRLSSDVDLLVLLKPFPDREIKGVFWSLLEFLIAKDFKTRTRDVSIQLEYKGQKVDLIPSYRGSGGTNILFNKRSGQAVETELMRHVHLIANSGRQQEICALKIWRERYALDFPSFYLELTVLQALQKERFGRLAENIHSVLRHLASNFKKASVVDPTNSSNVVSRDLSSSTKDAVAKAAAKALACADWQDVIW